MLTILTTMYGLVLSDPASVLVLAQGAPHSCTRIDCPAGQVVEVLWCTEPPLHECQADLGGDCPLDDGHHEILAGGTAVTITGPHASWPVHVYASDPGGGVVTRDWAGPADFNLDGIADTTDYFAFLGAFFAGEPDADFNTDTVIDSQDFYDYLDAFLGPQ